MCLNWNLNGYKCQKISTFSIWCTQCQLEPYTGLSVFSWWKRCRVSRIQPKRFLLHAKSKSGPELGSSPSVFTKILSSRYLWKMSKLDGTSWGRVELVEKPQHLFQQEGTSGPQQGSCFSQLGQYCCRLVWNPILLLGFCGYWAKLNRRNKYIARCVTTK